MEVQESEIGGIVVLRVKGRVDSSVAKNLETKIVGAVQQNAAVNVDFAGVSFISSAGLRALLVSQKLAKSLQKALSLSGLSPEVQEVFDISGFTALFRIFPGVDEATRGAS